MLPKVDRLTSDEVSQLSQGKSVFGTLLSIRYIPSEKLGFSISVSKKVASRAVDRNYIRRRIYSIIRELKKDLKTKALIMIMPKKECLTEDIKNIEKDLINLFHKANLS